MQRSFVIALITALPLLACGGGGIGGPTSVSPVEGVELISMRPSSGTVSLGTLNYRDCPQEGCTESLNVQFSVMSNSGVPQAKVLFDGYAGERDCLGAQQDVPDGLFTLVPGQPVAVTFYLIVPYCEAPFTIDRIEARVWDADTRTYVLSREWRTDLSFTN